MTNTPKTRRGAETRQKILSAAEECFSDRGYFRTGISDIARAADIAPGTFYIYFDDKLSLYRELMLDLGDRLRARIRLGTQDCASRLEVEERGIREFFGFASEHRGFFRIFWEAQFVDPAAFKDYYENFAAAYSQKLAACRDSGQVDNVDLTVLSYGLIGMTNFVALKYTVFDSGSVPEEALETIMTLLGRGVFRNGPASGDPPASDPPAGDPQASDPPAS